MKNCCEDKHSELMMLKQKQSRALKIVFVINALMFIFEFSYGWIAKSTALMGDSLDMLGDAFVYGFSLFVLYQSALMRAKAALLKGAIMLIFGITVLGQVIYKVTTGIVPQAETMGVVGAIALFANLFCLLILYSHKEDDINMKSTWICSRNDIIANFGTLGAAFLVHIYNSIWPDVITGTIIAVLFLSSSYSVLKESFAEFKSAI